MSFDHTINSLKNLVTLKSVVTTSGASRKKKVLDWTFLNKINNKKFYTLVKHNSGRARTGRITVFSKGKTSHKTKLPLINHRYRSKAISVLTSVNANLRNNNITTSIINSAGIRSIIPSALSHSLFLLSLFPLTIGNTSYLYNSTISLNSSLRLLDLSGLILSYKQGKHISNLELYPNKGIQYIRSAGCKGVILKSSTITNSSIIKLPSKVKKVFSVYSLASSDSVPFSDKSLINQTSSNKSTCKGIKPRSRGVAKNPVDHPHGGRTKAIRYPRTPWGKTTKFK